MICMYFSRSLNYGGMGVVMGHELTHGFDDQGMCRVAELQVRTLFYIYRLDEHDLLVYVTDVYSLELCTIFHIIIPLSLKYRLF